VSTAVTGSPVRVCRPLVIVRELVDSGGDWHNVTVPARRPATANSRENLVYISQGHVIQVAILTSGADVPFFMLKYEGKIDQTPPVNWTASPAPVIDASCCYRPLDVALSLFICMSVASELCKNS